MNSTREEVLALVSNEWQSVGEIHQQLDCWTRHCVRDHLHRLSKTGEIERSEQPYYNGRITRYRRVQSNVTGDDFA